MKKASNLSSAQSSWEGQARAWGRSQWRGSIDRAPANQRRSLDWLRPVAFFSPSGPEGLFFFTLKPSYFVFHQTRNSIYRVSLDFARYSTTFLMFDEAFTHFRVGNNRKWIGNAISLDSIVIYIKGVLLGWQCFSFSFREGFTPR